MATLSPEKIAGLLEPYVGDAAVPENLYAQLAVYLDLLVRWNGRTNLTAVREPEEMVRRHFGESLFAGLHLPEVATLLDFGSGAGFPGLPMQLLRPGLSVTLAESQGKKASFLREAVRTLGVAAKVWAGRVEDLPAGTVFEAVTLRAVDRMDVALAAARPRVAAGGWLVTLAGENLVGEDRAGKNLAGEGERIPMPGTRNSLVLQRIDFSRSGTAITGDIASEII